MFKFSQWVSLKFEIFLIINLVIPKRVFMGGTTSSPFWPAGQFFIAKLPDIKSFWTSTTTNADLGFTIWMQNADLILPRMRIIMLNYLCNPSIPAVDKLLHAHTPVPGGVEDHEQVTDLLSVQFIGFTLLILRQAFNENKDDIIFSETFFICFAQTSTFV